MALIKINNEDKPRFGKASATRQRVTDESGQQGIMITGILLTHDYIEEIHTIETERYLIKDIDVYQEDFGSNDNNILYTFEAGSIVIKDEHVPEDILWALEEGEIDKEIKEGQYYHTYAFEEGMNEAMKYAQKYKEKEEKENE